MRLQLVEPIVDPLIALGRVAALAAMVKRDHTYARGSRVFSNTGVTTEIVNAENKPKSAIGGRDGGDALLETPVRQQPAPRSARWTVVSQSR